MMIKISVLLNLLLLAACLVFMLFPHGEKIVYPVPASPGEIPPQIQESAALPAPAVAEAERFNWKELDSTNDYRQFVANLRAIGCPENTIADIVQGNVERAFAWERARLKIDGSGKGPWSQSSETTLINSLLDAPGDVASAISVGDGANGRSYEVTQTASGQNPHTFSPQNSEATMGADASSSQISAPAAAGTPSYLARFQSASYWGSSAYQGNTSPTAQAAPGDAQAQPNGTANPDTAAPYWQQSPQQNNGPDNANPLSWPSSQTSQLPSDPYALSAQDIEALQQEQYDQWFASHVRANPNDGSLSINPLAFSPQ